MMRRWLMGGWWWVWWVEWVSLIRFDSADNLTYPDIIPPTKRGQDQEGVQERKDLE